jgi:phosphatidylglycerol:prolipoprotein diacylglycerol transferase
MCLLAYFLWQLRDRVRPGVIFALYLVLSGLERLLVEFIRRNAEVWAGLTAPQLESIGLMIVGLVWLAWMARDDGVAGLRAGPAWTRSPGLGRSKAQASG